MHRQHRWSTAAIVAVVVLASGACEGPADSVADCDGPSAVVGDLGSLADPGSKDIAMQLVSSAENSTLDWRGQYEYLEDIGDGRGYTGGIVGFTSGTGDLLLLVWNYADADPGNPLAPYVPALQAVEGSDSHDGLGAPFEEAWRLAATDPRYVREFEAAQDALRDALYFDPAVDLARRDGLPILGQFAYYDAAVVHGPGTEEDTLGDLRARAIEQAETPAQGGGLTCYLDAFWQVRIDVMGKETAHEDVSRITDLQEKFANDGNYLLRTPLEWSVYGDGYRIP